MFSDPVDNMYMYSTKQYIGVTLSEIHTDMYAHVEYNND